MQSIRYITRKDLDTKKWNDCIDAAENGLIYAYSFYLDAMCDNWDALVMGDYIAVMPLPWRKKWGFKYVYRPSFLQQLGVFGNINLKKATELFLQQSTRHFNFGEYFINYKNSIQKQQHSNFILNLQKPYNHIYKSYKTDLKNNLKKANKNNLQYNISFDYEKAINLYKQLYQSRIKNLSDNDVLKLKNACLILQHKNGICIREVVCRQHGLVAIALCLKDHKRIYFIASSITRQGRILKANHFLADRLIHEFSEKDLLLDFEGSDIPGVQHFYKNFGAENQPYFFYRWNFLPWPFKLFKPR